MKQILLSALLTAGSAVCGIQPQTKTYLPAPSTGKLDMPIPRPGSPKVPLLTFHTPTPGLAVPLQAFDMPIPRPGSPKVPLAI